MDIFSSLGIGENVRKCADQIMQNIQRAFNLELNKKRMTSGNLVNRSDRH